jgi:hypothetical protein
MPIIDCIDEIQDLIKDQGKISIKLGLTGFPAKNKYPSAKLFINHSEHWCGTISDTVLSAEIDTPDDHLNIRLCYFDKTDSDTIVEEGKIIENQFIKINYLELNHVCISESDLTSVSLTNYDLTDSQQQAYTLNGAEWKNVKTNCLYNNAVWEINLKNPILSSLIKQKKITNCVNELAHDKILLKLQQFFKE